MEDQVKRSFSCQIFLNCCAFFPTSTSFPALPCRTMTVGHWKKQADQPFRNSGRQASWDCGDKWMIDRLGFVPSLLLCWYQEGLWTVHILRIFLLCCWTQSLRLHPVTVFSPYIRRNSRPHQKYFGDLLSVGDINQERFLCASLEWSWERPSKCGSQRSWVGCPAPVIPRWARLCLMTFRINTEIESALGRPGQINGNCLDVNNQILGGVQERAVPLKICGIPSYRIKMIGTSIKV